MDRPYCTLPRIWNDLRINTKSVLLLGSMLCIITLQLVAGLVGQKIVSQGEIKARDLEDAIRITREMRLSWEKAGRLRERFILHALHSNEDQAFATYALPIAERISTLVRNGVILKRLSKEADRYAALHARSQELDQYQQLIIDHAQHFEKAVDVLRGLTSNQGGLRTRLRYSRRKMITELNTRQSGRDTKHLDNVLELFETRAFAGILDKDVAADIPSLLLEKEQEFRGQTSASFFQAYINLVTRLASDTREAQQELRSLKKTDQRISSLLTSILAEQQIEMKAVYKEIDKTQQATSVALFAFFIGACIVMMLAAWILHRSITRKILSLHQVARTMQAGDLQARVAVCSHDEIGELGKTMNKLAFRLGDKIATLDALREAGYLLTKDHDVIRIRELGLQTVLNICKAAGAVLNMLDHEHTAETTALKKSLFYEGDLPSVPGSVLQTMQQNPAIFQTRVDEMSFFTHFPLPGAVNLAGVLSVYSHLPSKLSRDKVEAIELFTAQLAVSLSNAGLYADLENMVILDPLTGLYNRRGFLKIGLAEVQRALRHGRDLGLIFTDIDHFKRVNDTYDYETGDLTIKHIAGMLRAGVRENIDVCGRHGGEEFVLLLPEQDTDTTAAVAERIRKMVETTVVKSAHGPLCVTASFGATSMSACFDPDSVNSIDHEELLQELIARGGELLHKAKSGGRNRVVPDKPFGGCVSDAVHPA